MKMQSLKHIVPAILLAAMLVLAAGCSAPGAGGTKTKDGDKVLFTYDGTKVTLKEAWVYTKMEAKQMESVYSQYYGENFWNMAVDEAGTTFEDTIKENVVNQIKKIIVLVKKAPDYKCSLTEDDKAECKKFAEAFAKDQTGKEIMKECGATEKDLQKIYEDNKLAHKVQEAMVKDTDTNVSDDEARVSKVNRVTFSTVEYNEETGEEKKLNEKQKDKLKKRAEKALADIKKGDKDIKKVAEENNYSDQMEETFAKGESEEGKKFEKVVAKLKDGQLADELIETDHGYVIVQLVAKTDKDATKQHREEIIKERQQDAFNKKYDEWTKDLEKEWDYKKDVDQDLMAQMKLGEEPEEATTAAQPETTTEAGNGAQEQTTAPADAGQKPEEQTTQAPAGAGETGSSSTEGTTAAK